MGKVIDSGHFDGAHDDVVRATLSKMRSVIRKASKRQFSRELALKLTGGLKQKDYESEARIIHYWVRDYIRYVRDPRGLELLHAPEEIFLNRAGDCDDKTILAASMLLSIGHKVRLVAVGKDGRYKHVLPEVLLKIEENGREQLKWVQMETTEKYEFGQTIPEKYNLRMIMRVD